MRPQVIVPESHASSATACSLYQGSQCCTQRILFKYFVYNASNTERLLLTPCCSGECRCIAYANGGVALAHTSRCCHQQKQKEAHVHHGSRCGGYIRCKYQEKECCCTRFGSASPPAFQLSVLSAYIASSGKCIVRLQQHLANLFSAANASFARPARVSTCEYASLWYRTKSNNN
jgi:hypothetical protein